MKKLLPALIIIVIVGIFITGCSGPGYTMNSYLYVACEKLGAYGVATFKIENSGLLTPVTEALSTLLTEITSMVADHQGNRVYVAHNGTSIFTTHGINVNTGELFYRSSPPVSYSPQFMAIDPSDRFLGCTSSSVSQITIYNVNDFSNSVAQQSLNNPYGIAFNPLSHHCYITKYNSLYNVSSLIILTYDPKDGRVYDTWETTNMTTSELNHPAQIVVHPNGRYIYVVNDGTMDTISGFQLIDGPDRIQFLENIQPYLPNLFLAMDPAGRYLYAAALGSGTIIVYAISPETGQLTLKNQFVLDNTSNIRSIAVSPDGRFVYVSDLGRNVISMFQVTNDDTVLTPIGTDISTYDLWSGHPGVMTTAMKLQ